MNDRGFLERWRRRRQEREADQERREQLEELGQLAPHRAQAEALQAMAQEQRQREEARLRSAEVQFNWDPGMDIWNATERTTFAEQRNLSMQSVLDAAQAANSQGLGPAGRIEILNQMVDTGILGAGQGDMLIQNAGMHTVLRGIPGPEDQSMANVNVVMNTAAEMAARDTPEGYRFTGVIHEPHAANAVATYRHEVDGHELRRPVLIQNRHGFNYISTPRTTEPVLIYNGPVVRCVACGMAECADPIGPVLDLPPPPEQVAFVHWAGCDGDCQSDGYDCWDNHSDHCENDECESCDDSEYYQEYEHIRNCTILNNDECRGECTDEHAGDCPNPRDCGGCSDEDADD